ncbi:MAG: hypothetical protein RR655_08060, partial [Raoultibacter sp.]
APSATVSIIEESLTIFTLRLLSLFVALSVSRRVIKSSHKSNFAFAKGEIHAKATIFPGKYSGAHQAQ